METYQVQTCDQDALKWAQESLAKGDDLEPDRFPHLGNISAAHFFYIYPPPEEDNLSRIRLRANTSPWK